MMLNKIFVLLAFLVYSVAPWCLKAIFAGQSKVNSIDFSPDGQYILTGHSSGKLLLWHSKTLQILKTYDFNTQIYQAVFSKKQDIVAVAGLSTEVHLLNPSTLSYVDKITANHNGKIFDLDFQYQNDKLMTCGDDKKVKFWKTSNWNSASPRSQYTLHHQVYTCEYGDDNGAFVGAGKHFVTPYSPNYPANKDYQIHDDGTYDDFYSARVRPNSTYAILADDGGKFIEIQMKNSNANTHTFTETAGNILALGYSRDASYFIAAGSQKKVYVYNGTNRVNKLVQIIDTQSISSIVSARFAYDSNYFAVGNQNGTVYYYQRFCQGCPVGTYRNIDDCTLCTEALVGCAVCKNATKCVGCYGGYYLSSSKCSSCDILEGCAICQASNKCTQCLVGFYLSGLICKRCIDNHDGCYQCANASTCYQCDFNYYLDNTHTCVSCFQIDHCIFCNGSNYCLECVAGYYQSNGSCLPCVANCKICQQSNNCTQCVGGYYSLSGVCTPCSKYGCLFCNNTDYCFDCEEDFYASGGNCLNCLHPCSTCNTSTYCHSCVIGYYLSASGVCTNCPTGCLSCNTTSYCHSCDVGYFYHSTNHDCRKCSVFDPNCRQCNQTKCLHCKPHYYQNSGACTLCSNSIDNCQICNNGPTCQFCLQGFYLETNATCHICEVGCQACKSSTQCSVCQPGYYYNALDCFKCANNCLTCSDNTTCLSCPEGMYQNNNTCYFCSTYIDNCTVCNSSTNCYACSLGYYLASATVCSLCSPPCASCQTTSSNCLSCDQGFYLSGNICTKCSPNCSLCSASASNCHSCNAGFYLSGASCLRCSVPGCQQCENSTDCITCLNNYYESSGDCYACSSLINNCIKCDGNAGVCFLCEYGYALISSGANCSLCSNTLPFCQHCLNLSDCQTCMTGYFPDFNGDCQTCTDGCFSCLNASSCEQCTDNYVLDGGLCYHCEDQMMGCSQCTSKTVCISCINGYFLNGTKCSLCRDSIEGCEVCEDFDTCTLCSLFYQIQLNDSCKLCSQIYDGCQICDGNADNNNKNGCLQCKVGYYLTYTTSGSCTSCSVTDPGCTKCLDISTCEQCGSGYYLSLSNDCITCQTTYLHCIYCNRTSCLQCQAGFYLHLGFCTPCSGEGCEICLENSPSQCLTCNSHYTLHSSQCKLCSFFMDNCMQCSNSLTCTECSPGYYVNSSNKCSLCSETFLGCTYCTASGCKSCISNYFINETVPIPNCSPCFEFIKGCSYCVSENVCLSCQNGYYYQSSICVSCTQIYGCLYCENSTECIHCQQGYFLQNSECFLCSELILGCFACDERTICSSCQGHYQLVGGQCIQIEGEVVQQFAQLQLASYYIDEENLNHTLYTRGGMKYEPIEHQWNKQVELTIMNKQYQKIPLVIKSASFGSQLDSLTFTTDNPIGAEIESSMSAMPMFKQSSTQNRRVLATANVDLNYQFKLFMTEQVVHDILPKLDHTGDMYLQSPLSNPQFYKSFVEKQNYNYFIVGLLITILLLALYVVKISCLVPNSQNNGEIIPHLMAIRVGALALYPTFPEYINFCYGFMTSDFPWANNFFASIFSNESDVIPEPFEMYYVSLSLGSTYILAIIMIIVLWTLLATINLICGDKNPKLGQKIQSYKSLLYNLFVFGAVSAGCLSFQGAILNPISSLSLSSVFYIIGIIIYLGLLFQIFYSVFCQNNNQTTKQIKQYSQQSQLFNSHQNKVEEQPINEQSSLTVKSGNIKNIYKFRVYIKATVLCLLHLNPLYFFICLFSFQIFAIMVEHFLCRKERASAKMQTISHIIADLAIGINVFLPDALIGLIIVSIFAIVVLFIDTYCIYSEYAVYENIHRLAQNLQNVHKEDISHSSQEKSEHLKEPIRQPKKEEPKEHVRRRMKKYPKDQFEIKYKDNKDQTFIFAQL